MKITFTAGATSTEVGKKKPTKFYGGETADIVDKEARYLIDEGYAAKPGSKKAKAFIAVLEENPRTRRINLDAQTPGLAEKLAEKKFLKQARLKMLGEALNGHDKDADADQPPGPGSKRRPTNARQTRVEEQEETEDDSNSLTEIEEDSNSG